jgi:hypothetical protein
VTKRHDSASGSSGFAEEPLGTAQPRAETLGGDEVLERRLTVDLDHGEALAVERFELRHAADVHQLELEAELVVELFDDLERPRAEAAVGGVVDDDSRYGYRPRVVVASATRCTAMPYDAMRRLVA